MKEKCKSPEFWIVTGQSGAGKTNALRILEDWGYFCIDNLPPTLLGKTAEMVVGDGGIERVALGIDVRSRRFFDNMEAALSEMKELGHKTNILFLDADTPTLVKRFKETRRRHPMASEGELMEDIRLERKLLEDLRERADVVVDTSNLKVKELKEVMEARIGKGGCQDQFHVYVVSFGFKYGLPLDADLVMDVRFLPNPFYDTELRKLTGLDQAVRDYVMSHEVSRVFFEKYSELLIYLVPKYIAEGKSNLVVAIGCTGGQHRSVTLAEMLQRSLTQAGILSSVKHRDVFRTKEEA
ncbi:MAG: RNase adapter RapZ [Peptococcaceae bacterium]|nr:RNase adapter RapZ [Peptococcaceae bacterium]